MITVMAAFVGIGVGGEYTCSASQVSSLLLNLF